jgi:hypothetical protein
MHDQPMTEQELDRIFTNPFYCLPRIHEIYFHKHDPMITEEEFIEVGVKVINEIGARKYLRTLLDNLKGNDPYPGITELDVPDGYKLGDLKNKIAGLKPDEYLDPADEQELRDYVARLSNDPEYKAKVKTMNGQELLDLLEANGFTREDEEEK